MRVSAGKIRLLVFLFQAFQTDYPDYLFYKWSFTSESVLRVFGGKSMSDPDASGSVETRSDIKNEEVGSLEELQWSYGAPGRDNPIYNRWVFNQRCQKPDESIGDFVNALRKLIPGEIYKFKYRPVSPSEVAESQPLLEVNTYEYVRTLNFLTFLQRDHSSRFPAFGLTHT